MHQAGEQRTTRTPSRRSDTRPRVPDGFSFKNDGAVDDGLASARDQQVRIDSDGHGVGLSSAWMGTRYARRTSHAVRKVD